MHRKPAGKDYFQEMPILHIPVTVAEDIVFAPDSAHRANVIGARCGPDERAALQDLLLLDDNIERSFVAQTNPDGDSLKNPTNIPENIRVALPSEESRKYRKIMLEVDDHRLCHSVEKHFSKELQLLFDGNSSNKTELPSTETDSDESGSAQATELYDASPSLATSVTMEEVEASALAEFASIKLRQFQTVSLKKADLEAAVSIFRNILKLIRHSGQLMITKDIDLLPEVFCRAFGTSAAAAMPFIEEPAVMMNMTLQQFETVYTSEPNFLSKVFFVNSLLKKMAADSLKESFGYLHPSKSNIMALEHMKSFALSKLPEDLRSIRRGVVFKLLEFKTDRIKEFDKVLFDDFITMKVDMGLGELNSARHDWHVNESRVLYITQKMLLYIFRHDKEATIQNYSKFLTEEVVREQYVTAKILQGDMQCLAEVLSSSDLQRLMAKKVVEFNREDAPTFISPQILNEEPVILPLTLQNVASVEVNQYFIDTRSFFATGHTDETRFKNPVSAMMDLDLTGTVPHLTEVRKVEQLVHGQRFEMHIPVKLDPRKNLKASSNLSRMHRGAVVVEAIAAGMRCRAVLMAGFFRVFRAVGENRDATKGDWLGVLDESNSVIKSDASLLVAGKYTFQQNAEGYFLVPFSQQSNSEVALLTFQGFTFPVEFVNHDEVYHLKARWLFNREAVRQGSLLSVAVYPSMYITHEKIPVRFADLSNARYTLTTTVFADGVESVKVFENFVVKDDSESVFDVAIPSKVERIMLTLVVCLRNFTKGKEESFRSSETFLFNQIDETMVIETAFMRKSDSGHELLILGKNGEPRKNFAVEVIFKHQTTSNTVRKSARTNDYGCIELGQLKDVSGIGISCGHTEMKVWDLSEVSFMAPTKSQRYSLLDQNKIENLPSIFMEESDTMILPLNASADYMSSLPNFWDFVKGTTMALSSHREQVTFVPTGENTCDLKILPLLEGIYKLTLLNTRTEIHVVKRAVVNRVFDSAHSIYSEAIEEDKNCSGVIPSDLTVFTPSPQRFRTPPRVQSIETSKSGLHIRLSDADSLKTRVHCIVSFFSPVAVYADAFMDSDRQFNNPAHTKPEMLLSSYSRTELLNPDVEYVLKRRHQFSENEMMVGCTLKKPTVVLDAWKTQNTTLISALLDETVHQDSHGRANVMAARCLARDRANFACGTSLETNVKLELLRSDYSNYDFLSKTGPTFFNLRPNSQGEVFVPFKSDEKCELVFIVVDGESFNSFKIQSGNLRNIPVSDTAVRPSWPIESAISQMLTTSALGENSKLCISLSSEHAAIADIGKLYYLAESLADQEMKNKLGEFRFITSWNILPHEKQIELFSEYSCHELNLFLRFKDPSFFAEIAAPHIQYKSTKSFMDYFLLEDFEACAKIVGDISGSWNCMNVVEKILLAKLLEDKAESKHEELIKMTKTWTQNHFNANCMSARYFSSNTERRNRVFALLRNSAIQETTAELIDYQEESDNDMGSGFDLEGRTSPVELNRKKVFFTPLPDTSEFAERHYWNRRRFDSPEIHMNDFWLEYLDTKGFAAIKSKNIDCCLSSSDFTGFMFALAVADLKFPSSNQVLEFTKENGETLAIKSKVPAIVYHQEFKATTSKLVPSVMCNYEFYDPDNNTIVDKDTGETVPQYIDPNGQKFLTAKVYALMITITNTMSIPLTISALESVPAGSLAVKGPSVKNHHKTLDPFATAVDVCYFYFPTHGKYSQYPIHVSDRRNVVIASSAGSTLEVVDSVEKSMMLDSQGNLPWKFVCEQGSEEEVFEWLQTNGSVSEARISDLLPRCRTDRGFWERLVQFLRNQGIFSQNIWAFSVKYGNRKTVLEWLMSRKPSDLPFAKVDELVADEYSLYGKKDVYSYWPLVNERAHGIGERSRTNNKEFSVAYREFLQYLLVKPESEYNCRDHLTLICYLILQDRFNEASSRFDLLQQKIKSGSVIADLKVQLDYLAVWLKFVENPSTESLKSARDLASSYAQYPIVHWNELFRGVVAMVDEYESFFGDNSQLVQDDQSTQSPLQTEPALSFSIVAGENSAMGSLHFVHQNIKVCEVRFHALNLEMEFSSRPFAVAERFKSGGGGGSGGRSGYGGSIATHPHFSMTVEFPVGCGEMTVAIPRDAAAKARGNAAVEVVAMDGAISLTRELSESRLKCMLNESKGILQVLQRQGAASRDDWELASRATTEVANVGVFAEGKLKPLKGVYVKVYARLKGSGREVFYKDGYTDVLGRFEYASLSNAELLGDVELLSLLVSSEKLGDAVFTATPPKV
ncbi:hypothetical protein HDU84_003536 [Entophlyctis sp. JEL0112]|nr:hypothetical protein HDU84_003536 [Entophlyctis sp. JEL0112]